MHTSGAVAEALKCIVSCQRASVTLLHLHHIHFKSLNFHESGNSPFLLSFIPHPGEQLDQEVAGTTHNSTAGEDGGTRVRAVSGPFAAH